MTATPRESATRLSLIRQLLKGPVDADWPVEDRDLLAALKAGLEHWAKSLIFAERRERVLVCEAVSTSSDSSPGFEVVSTLERFTHMESRARLGPVCMETVLIPALSNTVDILENRDRRSIELVVRLAVDVRTAPLPDVKGAPELDLYCDASEPDDLAAFKTLSQGLWPRRLALSSSNRDVWPHMRSRRVWSPRFEGTACGALEILNTTRHYFDERFLRVPLAGLHEAAAGSGLPTVYSLSVRVGEVAGHIAEQLRSKLKVNHLPFWNRYIGLFDRSTDVVRDSEDNSVTGELPDGNVLAILECVDLDTGTEYVDERWAEWTDSIRCFDGACSRGAELRLRFKSTPPERLGIVYLAENVEVADAVIAPGAIVDGTAHKFVVRKASEAAGDGDEAALAHWLARGFSAPPAAKVVTRSDVEVMLWAVMPVPLRRLLTGSERRRAGETGVSIRTVLLPVADAPGAPKGAVGVYPVTVLTIPVRPDAGSEDVSYYCEWVARTIEAMCPIGTHIRVEARFQ